MDYDSATLLLDTLINDSAVQLESGFELLALGNETGLVEALPDDLPLYLRVTVFISIIVILVVGIVGNAMVTMVISCSRDMRTSTNFFLVNLSVADLLVLILVTPTALLEVIYDPETWLLGPTMCYVVPTLEMTVCHASILTILAISFERYYAICSPLKANYVCTRTRAVLICVIVWIVACIITSPMIFMTHYYETQNDVGVLEPKCMVGAGDPLPDLYVVTSILLFFLLPLLILLVTYGLIARRLSHDHSSLTAKNENYRSRRQVVLMLGTVVFTFFLCLLPFRLITLVVLVSDSANYSTLISAHTETYYTILYFTRIMTYVNSALNPILYNIMSSKFRNGFLRLCGRRRKQYIFHRNGTFLTLTTTTSHTLPFSTGLNNNLGSSPSTSPELILSSSLGRKGGVMIRKVESAPLVNRYCHGGVRGSSYKGTLIDPKALNRKFIYSYVSGHRSESML